MPSQAKAQALCDTWKDRYQGWVKSKKSDEYLQGLLACGSCEFCNEMRGDNPPENPYANCKSECIFYKPCFRTYKAIYNKIRNSITEAEADTIYQDELVVMADIFKENYGG